MSRYYGVARGQLGNGCDLVRVSLLSTAWQIDGERGATQGTYGLRRLVAALAFCRHVTPDRSRHDIPRVLLTWRRASLLVNIHGTFVLAKPQRRADNQPPRPKS
jgi:hypothetical protein